MIVQPDGVDSHRVEAEDERLAAPPSARGRRALVVLHGQGIQDGQAVAAP